MCAERRHHLRHCRNNAFFQKSLEGICLKSRLVHNVPVSPPSRVQVYTRHFAGQFCADTYLYMIRLEYLLLLLIKHRLTYCCHYTAINHADFTVQVSPLYCYVISFPILIVFDLHRTIAEPTSPIPRQRKFSSNMRHKTFISPRNNFCSTPYAPAFIAPKLWFQGCRRAKASFVISVYTRTSMAGVGLSLSPSSKLSNVDVFSFLFSISEVRRWT